MKEWLNSKIADPDVEDLYSEDGSCLPFTHHIIKLRDYNKYYTNKDKDQDQDVLASDDSYIQKINEYNKNKENNKNNKHLEYLDKRMEIYTNKKIFIPPNSNRYHANYLFKKMIDFSERDYNYNKDGDGTMYNKIEYILVDKNMKNAFYEFCYEHTT
uniref:Uncharacterized protein n=1 Tax=Mimivirus LCMiAC01 TaxID=2506608 RepID=A0A481Z064_9VIRU|nr:MAG: hypothetical protein LCMiAC01_05400 [Mimivirus LCMiAC01]